MRVLRTFLDRSGRLCQCSRGSRSGNRQIDAIFANRGRNPADLLRNVLAHPLDFLRLWRIMQQKLLCEPHSAKRQAEHLANVSTFGDGYLATASAEIEQEHVFVLNAEVRENPEMDQPPFFESGNDLDLPARRGFHPFEEAACVLGIAQWTGRDDSHLLYVKLLCCAVEPGEHLDGLRHCFGRER